MKGVVLILTGPGGSGKTTISNLLVEKMDFTLVDGDQLDSEFFPNGGQWLPENVGKLKLAHQKILNEVMRHFDEGKRSVVLDYIIFGDYIDFIESFKEKFGEHLQVRVLLPSMKEVIKRDSERECWTTGVERVSAVYEEFLGLKDVIGKEFFLDTTNQSPTDTIEKYFSLT